MLARSDGEDDNDDGGDVEGSERLLKGLTHQCSLSLHVEGLPTGFCRDIHGQVCQVDRFRLQLKKNKYPKICASTVKLTN